MHLLTKVLTLPFTGPIPIEFIRKSDKTNIRNAIFLMNSFRETLSMFSPFQASRWVVILPKTFAKLTETVCVCVCHDVYVHDVALEFDVIITQATYSFISYRRYLCLTNARA